ncbi:hypothetical protein MMSR116_29030 [Methylobacterium mesophilicum SR1.6/6]|uniref:Uncharacterized protein n=1 Tax=Methylobacterium mesophilicum SR1.6/6 TaxID=908290 RepID=A0A6B9FYS4_9HYPH|nr:hypothetical protein [Methylobacterium mesophilicum]QGY05484.1 hypothetical protein MMSR116_29030 [Methylobacterium mesophilicum SR1.6/6]
MDLFQFISSIVGSLAWPAVIAYLLYLLRHQLSALAKRLQEISLPGGGGAKFRDEVREAQNKLEVIVENDEVITISNESKSRGVLPRDKIRSRYVDLENKMSVSISKLPLSKRKIPADFIFVDLRPYQGSYPLYDVYSKIRDLSFMAVHADEKALSNQDAKDFDELCETFFEAFELQMQEYKKQQIEPSGIDR